jgi:hypothetical protein
MASLVHVRHDESFKFRALSAGAVMAFDGQTELHSSPVELSAMLSDASPLLSGT